MKTPEQMAEEYINHVLESQCDCSYRIAFLAGYQAAKDSLLAQFKSLLSSFAETSFNPNHTAWQIFDTLNETQAAKQECEGKIQELETQLENWQHNATHGDEGL